MYGRWASFWFSNSSKVIRKAADLPGSTYSKSRSILCVALWPLYSSRTKLWHLLPTLDVHCKSDHKKREQMVSVCRVCSGCLSATEQERLFCTGSLFQFSGQQTAVDPVPTEAGGIPKSEINDSITTLSAKAKKSDCTRSTEGSSKRKTKVSLVL